MKIIDLFETTEFDNTIVSEAPISDVEFQGSPTYDSDPITSYFQPPSDTKPETGVKSYRERSKLTFDKGDQHLLNAPNFKEKVINAFGKTPYDIKLIVAPSHLIYKDDNEYVDSKAKRVYAGVHEDSYGNIKADPKVITFVVLSNLSPKENEDGTNARMPLTPWTLAHKLGHVFQDDRYYSSNRNRNKLVDVIDQNITNILAANSHDAQNTPFNYVKASHWNKASKLFTFRSARTGNLKNQFELFPEIIAQFLIQGKVTLANEKANVELKKLNQAIDKLFKSLKGKIVVEV